MIQNPLLNAAVALRVEDSRATVVQSLALPTGEEVRADQLPDDPPDAALNTGVGAEIVIARNLRSCGWNVRYRANQAGLGYDLEATPRRADTPRRSQVFRRLHTA